MCGIAGILHVGTAPNRPDQALIERMTDTLAHRGPDDRGTWTDARVMLGHRRLAVIDLSHHGHQPMTNEDGSVVITFNGEIYNFKELADRHGLRQNHTFRSRTDTEVLVHLYEEIGLEAMARELNGMFALAIWDTRTQLLHLLRDPYGVKPLFWHQDAEHFRFGSEIKAIIADPRVKRRPSLQALHDFLSFDYVPGSQTAFEGIFELPPGHWMTVAGSGSRSSGRFWDASWITDDGIDEPTARRRALELMETAVERQLVADVPVGVMLSGGLDSSALVALMHRHSRGPIHTYSVGFEDASFNELPFARIVASRFGTVAREVIITADHVRAMLPRYLSFIDEPYADGSAIPTYYLCERAKGEVVVVLSGEGGDEAFAGYDTHAAHKASGWFQRVPALIRHRLIAPLVHRLPVSDKKLSLEFKLKRFLGGQDLPAAEAHLWWRLVLTEAQKYQIYSPLVREQLADAAAPVRFFREVFERSGPRDDLARILRTDASVFLPDDLMIKNDRMSMAHSLEARVPFTDPGLTDYLSRVPSQIKLPGLKQKHLMRTALRGILPDAIVDKKKVGLEMPYSRWMKRELRDVVDNYLSPERLVASGLFDPTGVARLVAAHMEGRADHGRALWGILNYMMWLDLYIPSSTP